jgi:hypothetical protein
METKKQTAVEWLFAHLIPHLDWSNLEDRNKFRQLEQEAKAIEKTQIVKAYTTGVEEDVYNNPLKTGEIFYNETYKL